MDKTLIQKIVAWLLILGGSFLSTGFLIMLAEDWDIGTFSALLGMGALPVMGGAALIRGANRRVKRLKNEKSERDILQLASQHGGRLTADEVAMQTRLSLEEARQKLENMQEAGHAHLEVSSQGAIVYLFPSLLPNGKTGGEIL